MMKIQRMKDVLLVFILSISPFAAVYADSGDWMVRLRGLAVIPLDDSEVIELVDSTGVFPLDGSGVDVDEAYVPELDITYMLTRRLGIELIAGVTSHDVSLKGPGPVLAAGGFTDGFKLFDTSLLPPTLTLQFHFNPDGKFRPYIGAGGNYSLFLNEEASSQLESALGPVNVKLDNSFGWAAQAGIDIALKRQWYTKHDWFFNIDVKYIDMDTTAILDTTLGQRFQVDVDINPLIFGMGLGIRF